jgi:hypothetical protein
MIMFKSTLMVLYKTFFLNYTWHDSSCRIQSNKIATDAVALERQALATKIDDKLKDRKQTGIHAEGELKVREDRLKAVEALIRKMRVGADLGMLA